MKTWTKTEQNELAVLAQAGSERAKAELLLSMEGLIIKIAGQKSRITGVEREDLKSEGRMAVLAVIDKFDAKRPNADFGAMASFYITDAMNQFTRVNMGAVSMPRSRLERAVRFKLRAFISESEKRGLSFSEAMLLASKHFKTSELDLMMFLQAKNRVYLRSRSDEDESQSGTSHWPVSDDDAVEDLTQNQSIAVVRSILSEFDEIDREFLMMRMMSEKKVSLEKCGSVLEVRNGRERLAKRERELIAMFQQKMANRGLSLSDLF